ncbi:MAG: M20/M25/M40 family metallo-hydrolase [Terriglobales bacterium]
MCRSSLLLSLALLLALGAALPAQPPPAAIAWGPYQDLAQNLMQEYLRIDTSNPPGNEMRAVAFWKNVFDREGIENHVYEFAPGRGNILAILHAGPDADSGARPLILLNHEDVVTSVPARWLEPPFAGAVRDGELYGRGSEDMKNEGLAQAMVMIVLKREHIPLKRDVIFLATGDEEVDDLGSAYMIAHQRAALRNAEYLLTEGGDTIRGADGRVAYVGVDVAEKAPFWLHLDAHGTPGHASRPIPDSAPNRLIRALARIEAWQPPIRLLPQVEDFFHAIAPQQPPLRRRQFEQIRQSLSDPAFARWISAQSDYNYMLRDTVSITMLRGSQQTNVIPSEAWANLDVRLLPGTDPAAFQREIERVIADPAVRVSQLSSFRPPNSSPTGSELYRIIAAVAAQYFPGAPVTPKLLSGFTESEMYRRIGIACYGFSPYAVTEAESDTEHGDNERIAVSELRAGPRVLFEVVRRLAAR